ncbi:MAG: hypothetical protein VBE63_21760 [Lamprobacter sp.]|uniref:hypothetical protein n=1 Tax=Lamprobacter sp. TaxID=3100796 RepID=UPI002B25E3D5|nr:hypothetical protein [Lamprobacter sp.]MEA3642544.1 hypothetical protein [Lamprobacter sp.]
MANGIALLIVRLDCFILMTPFIDQQRNPIKKRWLVRIFPGRQELPDPAMFPIQSSVAILTNDFATFLSDRVFKTAEQKQKISVIVISLRLTAIAASISRLPLLLCCSP